MKMKSMKDGCGYNERLFNSGRFRKNLHLARFKWVSDEISNLNLSIPIIYMLELGCFDGKLIDFLPYEPYRYIGFDANHEGGINIAKEKYVTKTNFSFFQASSPEEMLLNDSDKFNIAIAMETLEHVPPYMVDDYLLKIAQHLEGYFFVTAPNEKGLVFLLKWLVKKIFSKDTHHYSPYEMVNAFLGRMALISRNQHKGFDYDELISSIKNHFDVIKVCGIPFEFLPNSLNFGVGIIAKSKKCRIEISIP